MLFINNLCRNVDQMFLVAIWWFQLNHRETLIEAPNRLLLLLCFVQKICHWKVWNRFGVLLIMS